MTDDYYLITKEIEFDAGHRVPNHSSKCRNPHGHRYKLRAYVRGPIVTDLGASDEGMVADFGEIKKVMTERVHDLYDHGFIVAQQDDAMIRALQAGSKLDDGPTWKCIVVFGPPTAENMAKWIYDDLKHPIEELNGGLELVRVVLFETPTSAARYPG